MNGHSYDDESKDIGCVRVRVGPRHVTCVPLPLIPGFPVLFPSQCLMVARRVQHESPSTITWLHLMASQPHMIMAERKETLNVLIFILGGILASVLGHSEHGGVALNPWCHLTAPYLYPTCSMVACQLTAVLIQRTITWLHLMAPTSYKGRAE